MRLRSQNQLYLYLLYNNNSNAFTNKQERPLSVSIRARLRDSNSAPFGEIIEGGQGVESYIIRSPAYGSPYLPSSLIVYIAPFSSCLTSHVVTYTYMRTYTRACTVKLTLRNYKLN